MRQRRYRVDHRPVRIRLHRRAVALRGQELLGRSGHDRLIALLVGCDRGRPALPRHVGQRTVRRGDRAPELLIERRELLLRERLRSAGLTSGTRTRRGGGCVGSVRGRRIVARTGRYVGAIVGAALGAVVGSGGSVGTASARSRGICASTGGGGCERRCGAHRPAAVRFTRHGALLDRDRVGECDDLRRRRRPRQHPRDGDGDAVARTARAAGQDVDQQRTRDGGGQQQRRRLVPFGKSCTARYSEPAGASPFARSRSITALHSSR